MANGNWARSDKEKATVLAEHLSEVFEPFPRMSLNSKKAKGYDLITANLLKELPTQAIRYIIYIFNAVFRCHHFPSQWNVAQIILIPKPGSPGDQPTSFRPVSLLPILWKVLTY